MFSGSRATKLTALRAFRQTNRVQSIAGKLLPGKLSSIASQANCVRMTLHYILNLVTAVCNSCAKPAKVRLEVAISSMDASCSSVAADTP